MARFGANVNKTHLQQALLQQLRQDHSAQLAAAQVSRDEAVSEESRAENKYDTRGQEAAYLAEGQARLAAELAAACSQLAATRFPAFAPGAEISIGALVTLRSPATGEESHFLLSPVAGGAELSQDGRAILVLTPSSPLGRQLLGRRAGQRVPWRVGTLTSDLEITGVA